MNDGITDPMVVPDTERGGDFSGSVRPLRDRAWTSMLGSLDEVLRRRYRVREYSAAPDCVFRVAFGRAEHDVSLADGTRVCTGDVIGVLHFWNEQLLRFPPDGPDIAWAKTMQQRIDASLCGLRDFVQHSPEWAEIDALRAEVAVPRQRLAREQMRRLARWHGFETDDADDRTRGRVRLAAENMLLWGFTRAYNPSGATRNRLWAARQTLWLSRRSLLDRPGIAPDRRA